MRIWLERSVPRDTPCQPRDQGIPGGCGCCTGGALTSRKMFAETAKMSHLGKYFNPECFTAVSCCLVHIDGGKKPVQNLFVMKVKSFEEFWDKVGGWMGTSWSCVWSWDAAMQPRGQGWSQRGRTSPGMSQRMECAQTSALVQPRWKPLLPPPETS